MSEVFRDCVKCGEPVHRNQKRACKACGATSPWVEMEAAADVAGETLTMADVERAKQFLRDQDDKPVLHVVETTSDDFNPSPETVGAFMHDLTSPARQEADERAAELTKQNGPQVFMERFSTMIGNTLAHFKQGQVVTDFALIQVLKAQGNVPMVPYSDAPGMACCPKCNNVFRVPAVLPSRRVG